jgi:hypothetical protein
VGFVAIAPAARPPCDVSVLWRGFRRNHPGATLACDETHARRVHFVAIAAAAPIVATLRTYGVRFAPTVAARAEIATKCTLASPPSRR